MKDSFQDQIFKIVFAKPGINQNEIWRKAKNIHGKPTFEKNLKILIKNETLIEEKDPAHSQKKLFFVNGVRSQDLNSRINILDLIDESFTEDQSSVYDFLKKSSINNTPKITKGLINVFSLLIDDILEISNYSLAYGLMGNQMFYQKSERIRIKQVTKLKKSLKLLRKKNELAFKDMIAFTWYKLKLPY